VARQGYHGRATGRQSLSPWSVLEDSFVVGLGHQLGRCPRTSENRTMDRLLNRPCFVEAKVWRTHHTTIEGREGRQGNLEGMLESIVTLNHLQS